GRGLGPGGYGPGRPRGGGRDLPTSLVTDGEIHCERAEPHTRSQWRAIQQQRRERDTGRGKNGGGITGGNGEQRPKPAGKHIGGREEQHLEEVASGSTGTEPDSWGQILT